MGHNDKKKKKSNNNDADMIPYDEPNHMLGMPGQALLTDQRSKRSGNNVPEFMLKNPHKDSGFFFGVKRNLSMGCVMKPSSEDGHILVVGGPGSHKTSALIVPTLKTWREITIAIDIKKDHLLWNQWNRYNRHTEKRVKVFSPAQEYGCGYDPYAFLRDDGEENFVNNVRELALALLPISPETKDPIKR